MNSKDKVKIPGNEQTFASPPSQIVPYDSPYTVSQKSGGIKVEEARRRSDEEKGKKPARKDSGYNTDRPNSALASTSSQQQQPPVINLDDDGEEKLGKSGI